MKMVMPFDEETGKPLGRMFGEKVRNHPVELSMIEKYSYWVFCSCGYHENSLEAKFCGGCGHPIKLPDFLREEAESAWYPPDFIFEDNQWFKVEGNKKVALQPEINGVFDI